MRLVTYDDLTPGLLQGNQVFDLSPALSGPGPLAWDERMPAIIAGFARLKPQLERLARSGKGVPVDKVRLRAPIPRPSKIACAVANYREEGGGEPPALDFFFKSPEAIIGPGDAVVLPKVLASMFPREAELAVVMGREATNVPAKDAMEYVFGYTAFLDVSAKDVGRPQVGTFMASSFDTFAPMGPWLVTAEELPDPHRLQVRLSVNGALRQDYNTSGMVRRVPELIAYASSIFTLYPGDVITCGSAPQGTGPLQDGDLVAVEVQGIGSLTVTVRDPLKRSWPR